MVKWIDNKLYKRYTEISEWNWRPAVCSSVFSLVFSAFLSSRKHIMNEEEWKNQHTFHEIFELPFCCAQQISLSFTLWLSFRTHKKAIQTKLVAEKSSYLCSIPYSFSNDLILASLRQINCQYLWMSLEEKILNKYLVYRRVSDNKISPYLCFFVHPHEMHTYTQL